MRTDNSVSNQMMNNEMMCNCCYMQMYMYMYMAMGVLSAQKTAGD